MSYGNMLHATRSFMLRRALLCAGLAVVFNGLAQGAITYVKVTNDADSGISSSNTYTHAIDFSNSTTVSLATINGVAFTGATGNITGFTRTVANGTASNHNGPGTVTTTGNLANLMQGFLYNNNPLNNGTGLQTYTISGLTSGVTYDLRIYSHQWTAGSRPNTLVFNIGGTTESTGVIDQDNATSVGMASSTDSYYINYRYTATSSSLTWTAANSSGSIASWHLYGLTNQVVPVPEPSSCLLGMLGCLLFLLHRRRK